MVDIFAVDKDWHARRQLYLNASEIACLFGAHKYLTLATMVARKRDFPFTREKKNDSPLLRRGNALEPVAAAEIAKLQPTWTITKCEHQYVDRDLRIAATPDFLVADPNRSGVGVLQIKVVASSIWRREYEDAPPLGHLLQLSTEMMLTPDATWGALGVLVIGDFAFEAALYPVDRNDVAEDRLREAAKEFWRVFDSGDQPALDFARDGALIAAMYPKEEPGKVLNLSGDNRIAELLDRRERLRGDRKIIEADIEACDNEIKAKLGDASVAIVPGWKVTFKLQHRDAYEVAAQSFRVLRTTRTKEVD
jgi:predicted phage-related endonuclease